jgi:hypothetical protein
MGERMAAGGGLSGWLFGRRTYEDLLATWNAIGGLFRKGTVMEDLALALGLGLATGILLLGLIGPARAPMVAWVALAPLCAAAYIASPVVAGVSAFLAAGVALGFGYHGMFPFARALEVFLPLVGATMWGVVSVVAAWL